MIFNVQFFGADSKTTLLRHLSEAVPLPTMSDNQLPVADTSIFKTCLLLIDNQVAFDHPTHWGTERSTPKYKENLTALLRAARSCKDKPLIIHVQHHNNYNPRSILHPDNPAAATELYPFASPVGAELLIQKHKVSAFVDTKLEDILRQHDIQQLVVAGLVTDGCISTTIRMARDLDVTMFTDGRDGSRQKGPIVLVEDSSATFGKDGFDAETFHQVHVASLRGEFAYTMTTIDVLREVFR